MSRNLKARTATPVDAHVGRRIRAKRDALDMSQTELAQACKITFQQIQKYENGGNRVSASRLWQMCAIFGVSIDYFFDGLAQPKLTREQRAAMADRNGQPVETSSEIEQDTMKIARSIAELRDPAMRKRIKSMLSALTLP